MARSKKVQPTLDALIFATPEQKVLRYLLTEPTTTFTLRVIASKLKGIRGLGGAEGISRILSEFHEIGLTDQIDNGKAVRLKDDIPALTILKKFSALCDLDGLRQLLEGISSKGLLFGSRARGSARSDSDYDLYVVSDQAEDVVRIVAGHPFAKKIIVTVKSTIDDRKLDREDPVTFKKLEEAILLWGGSAW